MGGLLGGAAVGAGCGGAFVGTYEGESVESGSVEISVPMTDRKATNETAPRAKGDASLIVERSPKGELRARFGPCDLGGSEAGATVAVVKGRCEVALVGYEGPLELSGTLSLEGGKMAADVTGTAKNATAIVTYKYTFRGSKVR
jgi:hypothetical protein